MAVCSYFVNRGGKRTTVKSLRAARKVATAYARNGVAVVGRTCGAKERVVFVCAQGKCYRKTVRRTKSRKLFGRTKQTAKKTLSGWASHRRMRGERS